MTVKKQTVRLRGTMSPDKTAAIVRHSKLVDIGYTFISAGGGHWRILFKSEAQAKYAQYLQDKLKQIDLTGYLIYGCDKCITVNRINSGRSELSY